jgi:two-component system response regulator FixJ
MTVALIEDDEAVLHSLQLLLERRGIAVRCFSSAESFLRCPPTCQPALSAMSACPACRVLTCSAS